MDKCNNGLALLARQKKKEQALVKALQTIANIDLKEYNRSAIDALEAALEVAKKALEDHFNHG